MLLSLGVLFTLRFFGLGETKPAIITEIRPQYRLVYVAPDPAPVGAYHHIGPPELYAPFPPKQWVSASENSPQPILSNHVAEPDASNGQDDSAIPMSVGGYEVSQFHSEDENGKVVYGFRSPDQAKMEARDSDGTVRGMYSYVDALGNIIKMQYWDDGHGMHMAGNNLPIAMFQTPEFTPEVRAAREEHFRLYEAALSALKAAGLEVEGHELEEEDDDDDVHIPMAPASSTSDERNPEGIPLRPPTSDEEDDFDQLMHEPVIIENESIEKDPINKDDDDEEEYPKYEYTPQHAVSHVQLDDNEDKESVAIENPEIPSLNGNNNWRRQGKSHEMDTAETKDTSSPTKASENNPDSHGKQGEAQQAIGKSSLTKEQIVDLPGGGKSFFYHFTHVIPKPVERIDDASLKSAGLAVHDVQQSSPLQAQSQQYPIYRSQVV